jgi:hypothetical protein
MISNNHRGIPFGLVSRLAECGQSICRLHGPPLRYCASARLQQHAARPALDPLLVVGRGQPDLANTQRITPPF